MKNTCTTLIFLIVLVGCSKKEDRVAGEENGRLLGQKEIQILNWFESQQLENGLVISEKGSWISLYDNALAAMVFISQKDYGRAEKIFDYFNGRISAELTKDVGGFSQLRNSNGVPNKHRWMGDNAWLLIALNNYKASTGNTTYDNLALEISTWLQSLQDTDGGLFAGYDAENNLLNYKVSEGMIDAFNAIEGYDLFHQELLNYLEKDRWDASHKTLVSWPSNPKYLYALDLHPWGYLIFNNFPVEALHDAQRFVNTQVSTSGVTLTGYCFDEDKDVVWLEGTGQMALAYGAAGLFTKKNEALAEMDRVFKASVKNSNAGGFTYATNPGTTYGADLLWASADTEIAISSGAWYLYAKSNFNPFAVGRKTAVPVRDMFWTD
jgi:hypothetical protein